MIDLSESPVEHLYESLQEVLDEIDYATHSPGNAAFLFNKLRQVRNDIAACMDEVESLRLLVE